VLHALFINHIDFQSLCHYLYKED